MPECGEGFITIKFYFCVCPVIVLRSYPQLLKTPNFTRHSCCPLLLIDILMSSRRILIGRNCVERPGNKPQLDESFVPTRWEMFKRDNREHHKYLITTELICPTRLSFQLVKARRMTNLLSFDSLVIVYRNVIVMISVNSAKS